MEQSLANRGDGAELIDTKVGGVHFDGPCIGDILRMHTQFEAYLRSH